ncbi:hypothetical protein BLA39750_05028 [Burkholderia lata]|uniref:Uncharacterized protein n=1 Tax=Burkholderia lata (strain ATCC 17760 / DSM 23089 / LMG 22485 / NCIMB 9086 / R18194 / 383) TaxID=482957 RepID=A0A6P2ZMM7_BURL3|nr:hypothetical protein [Burkholderia lata]VWD36221.1 hypothetical protein BLA39750_05028 [Burkholderia lata]
MDANEEFANELSKLDDLYSELEGRVYEKAPSPGYVIPMLLDAAIRRSNHVVDIVQRYSSADHGSNFATLLLCIRKCSGALDEFSPYFDRALEMDESIANIFRYEFARLLIQDRRISSKERLWSITKDLDGIYHIRLTKKMQRSALHVLSNKANYIYSSREIQKLLEVNEDDRRVDVVKLALANKLSELDPLRLGLPDQWAKFLSLVGVSEPALIVFQAFFPFLNSITHRCWFKESEIIDLMSNFEENYGVTLTSQGEKIAVLRLLSPEVKEASEWGLAVPFVKIGTWYMRWPFAYHVMHPNLMLLALLMKQGADAWNNTIGSHAARVSDYLVSQLPKSDDLLYVTRRIKNGIGDIDIAIYNKITGDLIVCEVKTVFDRFRTNYQISNFSDQRVNYQKAAKQLRASKDAILSGKWRIKDIFGLQKEVALPKRISLVVLTWWDIFDPFKGGGDHEIATANFSTFRYLADLANGDLDAMHRALIELSNLPCPGVLCPDMAKTDDFDLQWVLDRQTDALPPKTDRRRLSMSHLASLAIDDIASFPDEWADQVAENGEDPNQYTFYS